MNAKISGASPWTRTAIRNLTDDELEQIDQLIPDGMFVTLGAARRPGNWVVHLMQDGRYPQAVGRVTDVHSIVNGVRLAVANWRKGAAA